MRILLSILLFVGLGWSDGNAAECLLNAKPAKSLVVDQADIFGPDFERSLANDLAEFNRETSNQILVVTVEDLCGYDKAEFTYTLGEKWGVGQKEFDNGIVLMIKPHGNRGDRHTFIAVGYGLEGAIPDAISKRIVENELIPYFKTGDFEAGTSAAINILKGLASGEISQKQYNPQPKVNILPFLFIILIIFLVIYANVKRARRYSLGHDVSFWTALWLLSNTGHRRGGGWNDFNSGGGNFGGFGGFGGGSFGGGGAGGSW